MSTDQQRAAEDLRTRLDQSDRRRRGWYVAGAVAVAIAVVVVALRRSARPARPTACRR